LCETAGKLTVRWQSAFRQWEEEGVRKSGEVFAPELFTNDSTLGPYWEHCPDLNYLPIIYLTGGIQLSERGKGGREKSGGVCPELFTKDSTYPTLPYWGHCPIPQFSPHRLYQVTFNFQGALFQNSSPGLCPWILMGAMPQASVNF